MMNTSNSSTSASSSSSLLKKVKIWWEGHVINFGSFPAEEAEDISNKAKALTAKWRQQVPKPSKLWVTTELQQKLPNVSQCQIIGSGFSSSSGNANSNGRGKAMARTISNNSASSTASSSSRRNKAKIKSQIKDKIKQKQTQTQNIGKSGGGGGDTIHDKTGATMNKSNISVNIKRDIMSSTANTNNSTSSTTNVNNNSNKKQKTTGSISGKWILDKRLGKPSLRPYLETMNIPDQIINSHIAKDESMDIMCHIQLTKEYFQIQAFYIQDDNYPCHNATTATTTTTSSLIHNTTTNSNMNTNTNTNTNNLNANDNGMKSNKIKPTNTTKTNSNTTSTTKTTINTMKIPIGKEVIENHGSKSTFITTQHPTHVHMKRNMYTVTGYTEMTDVKDIIHINDIMHNNNMNANNNGNDNGNNDNNDDKIIPDDYTERPEWFMRQILNVNNHQSGKKCTVTRYYLPVYP